MESNYGYVIGVEPTNNMWTSESKYMMSINNTVIVGYEGTQTESDENVIIIGDVQQFEEWRKLNTILQ